MDFRNLEAALRKGGIRGWARWYLDEVLDGKRPQAFKEEWYMDTAPEQKKTREAKLQSKIARQRNALALTSALLDRAKERVWAAERDRKVLEERVAKLDAALDDVDWYALPGNGRPDV